jgi:hypothetical protein
MASDILASQDIGERMRLLYDHLPPFGRLVFPDGLHGIFFVNSGRDVISYKD